MRCSGAKELWNTASNCLGDNLVMLIYATVLFTILSALGFGVISGYVLIIGILHLFRHNSVPKKQPASATALRAAAAQASGD